MLLAEREHISITFWNALKTCIMNPFFMGLYLPIYIVALFKKEVKWKPIEHTGKDVTNNKEKTPN